ncbi:unnamed protein product [Symbiodinium sp. CCMP2456]|nr:unnamed protein product [Symbiodinium sp. CCMP2456]
MVSTSIVAASDLQHHEVHPGRLNHIRIPRGQSHVDIVNLYQYAASDSDGVYERRMGLLTKLQKCVAGLPQRNSVVLGGDFNCPLEPHPPQCGHCVLPHNPIRYKDYRDHENVVQTLNLVALNTWCKPRHGQLATFTFGSLASQIDYLMVRSRQANSEARRAQVIDQFPVAAWREGANHHPVEARIPVPRLVPKPRLPQASVVRFGQDALPRDAQQAEATPSLTALRQEVSARLREIGDANEVLIQAANKHYPLPPRPPRQPDQPEALANSAKHMWALHRAMTKCEATFGTAAALKTHARRAHDIIDEHPVVFNKAEHALGGLPTCSKCHKKFSKWQTLAQHINQNSCPQMIVQPMPVQEADAHMNMPATNLLNATTQVLCQRTEVVRASQKGINAFIQLSDISVREQTQNLSAESGHSQSYLPLLWRDLSMLADPDLNEFFGEVSQEQSLKRRRPTEDSKGQGKGQAQKNKEGKNDELVTTLARLALRQEEELQVLKQDHSFMMFMKPGKTATLFKKKQAESPTWGTGFQPAHQVLALALFRELASRLELLGKDQAKLKEVVDMGWATPELAWKFQAWNPQLRILQEDKDRKPLTTAEVKHSLEKLYAAAKTGVVTRFSCTRKLTETMENQASFYFDLSGRGAGIEAWEHMEKLEACCVLQLVGLAYKRAGLRRGLLAQKLRELLGQR